MRDPHDALALPRPTCSVGAPPPACGAQEIGSNEQLAISGREHFRRDELEGGLAVMGQPGEPCGGDGQECCIDDSDGGYACAGAGLVCAQVPDWGPLLCQRCAQPEPREDIVGPAGLFECPPAA